MGKRREGLYERCSRCGINTPMCFCNQISPIDTETHISLIFHKKEYFLSSNTGKIAHYSLKNSSFEIRGYKDQPLEEDYTLGGRYTPYYLYPSEDAAELNDDFLKEVKKPINLIVPDATWRQASKFHKREPNLFNIPHLKVPFKNKSMYELRKQKYEDGLCTMEAIAYSLGALGEAEAQKHLLKTLKVMNDKVMKTRNGILEL